MNKTDKAISQTDYYKMFLDINDRNGQIELISNIIENEVSITPLGISVKGLFEKRHQILSILKHILSQQILNESDLKAIGEAIDVMIYLTSFSKDMKGYSAFKMEVYTYLKDYRHIEVINEYLYFLNS